MRSVKRVAVLAIAVFALSVIGVASASAAQFTDSATGNLAGEATETQSFHFNGGTVSCNIAESSGTITSVATSEITMTFTYKGCTGPFGSAVDPFQALYVFTANGVLHIEATITMKVTTVFGTCHYTVTPQGVGTITYSNIGNNLKIAPNVTGIKYESSNIMLCGSSGENGTYTGINEIHRVGGGSISFDP